MGTAYSFECPSCGYSAEVCGGTDSGFGATLRTSVCADCHAVVDVLIGGPSFFGGEPVESDDPDVGRCPQCKGRNVTPWKRSRPCPKCQSRMKKGGALIMWD
jgi:hypothetical protein